MSEQEKKSIIYIFNEMDPSEEVEFERELRRNNDSLIEVESLRNAKDRLDGLPEFSPPADVVDNIIRKAEKKTRNSRNSRLLLWYSAAAALLLIGFTSGILLTDDSERDAQADRTEPVLQTQTAGARQLSAPLIPVRENTQQNRDTGTAAGVTPWVDRNEVIRFSDRFGINDAASTDSVFLRSFNKLTPVPDQSRFNSHSLHLTGSRQ